MYDSELRDAVALRNRQIPSPLCRRLEDRRYYPSPRSRGAGAPQRQVHHRASCAEVSCGQQLWGLPVCEKSNPRSANCVKTLLILILCYCSVFPSLSNCADFVELENLFRFASVVLKRLQTLMLPLVRSAAAPAAHQGCHNVLRTLYCCCCCRAATAQLHLSRPSACRLAPAAPPSSAAAAQSLQASIGRRPVRSGRSLQAASCA